MRTIVIADGLTPEVFSPAVNFQANPMNLGRREIDRLFGIGRAAGNGPLPSFLDAVARRARREPGSVELIFVCDRAQQRESGGDRTADLLIEPVATISRGFDVVPVAPGAVPWRSIPGCSSPGAESDGGDGDADPINALVIGAHTELRVAATAIALKTLFGFDRVAVCSHLSGSATREAHFAALRHDLPCSGVEVFLDLTEAAEYAGLDKEEFARFGLSACTVTPPELSARLDPTPRRLVERLCMHWTSAELRSLTGGFSGSLLFIAEGRLGEARTEPMVIKIDRVEQMRRELAGYYLVKDFVGKHVPSFGFPVAAQDKVGIGMELAAMEGMPRTLQELFEAADSDLASAAFFRILGKALQVMSNRLYRNTSRTEWVVPYREFLLHTPDQVAWLGENAENILRRADEEGVDAAPNVAQLQTILGLIAANENGVESQVCLSHGDLNLQNIISDAAENLWFIDWTHAADYPVEMDFAKLENDVKFVISKDFDAGDLARLRQFEDFLLDNPLPPEPEGLPDHLRFVKWDLRYRKLLTGVAMIRRACFDLHAGDNWLVYRIALLKYALHTLSFDSWRGRGECGPVQLLHALHSVETLVFELVADDFHLRIRAERPDSYPPRQLISIDEAPWGMDSANYAPRYYVAPEVLDNAGAPLAGRWAHPENFSEAEAEVVAGQSTDRDDGGRPLNPRGRTGLAGRGMLGRWGVNPAVGAVLVRYAAAGPDLEILVGRREGRLGVSLPRGLVFPRESPDTAIVRVLAEKTGLEVSPDDLEAFLDDYFYDLRQTDHAWLELRGYLVPPGARIGTSSDEPSADFDEIDWWPLAADTINELGSGQARLVRAAMARLQERGLIAPEHVERSPSGSSPPTEQVDVE